MIAYTIRRLGQSILVVIGVTIIVFGLLHLLPGGPARAILGGRASAAEIHQFDVENNYDRALPMQYVLYLDKLIHGNLGYSYHYNQSVNSLLAQNIPKTAVLVGVGYALAVIVGVLMGLVQALRRGKVLDQALTGVTFIAYGLPNFWAGMLLIDIFAITLPLLPSQGPQGDTLASLLEQPVSFILPVVTLALINLATFSRFMRSGSIDTMAQDYVRTARAKGLSEMKVVTRHVLRNSLIPVITMIGLTLPITFSGAVVVEAVFNYPGMGLLFWTASLKQDFPLLMGFTLVVSIAAVVGNLLADICYAVADPRVRYA